MKKTLCLLFAFVGSLITSDSFANHPCSASSIPTPPHDTTCILGTTVGAQPLTVTPFPCSAVNGEDVWYQTVVPSCVTSIIVNLQGNDDILYLYKDSCTNLTSLFCGYCTFPSNFVSDTLTNLIPGDTIFIRVFDHGTPNAFTLCLIFHCPTGLDETTLLNGNISVFPNPAKDVVEISGNQLNGSMLDVFDVRGQKIFSLKMETPSRQNIDITSLSPGLYFFRITSGEFVEVKKIAISR